MVISKVRERVKQYNYLSTTINKRWDITQEIKCRIGEARTTYNKISAIFKSHNLSLTNTLNSPIIKKIEAFELWLYRRILRLPYIARIRNVEVLREMNKDTE